MFSQKIFYHIYPLGFCGCSTCNSYNQDNEEKLLKIIDWIPHMKYLGVNSLYLGPIFESKEHGYDTTDYFRVDSRLGTNQTLKKLVKALKSEGISVILDGVFNHVGRDFFAFSDVQRNGQNSIYTSWFDGLDFSKKSPYNDCFTYKTWDGHYNLVKLNLKNPQVKSYLLEAVKFWIEEFSIDGLRLDACDVLDIDFLKELSLFTKSINSNFWIMGEVVHGDYNHWIVNGQIDSTTNYECYKGMYSSINDKNYFEIAYSLKRLFGENGLYKNHLLYNFVDNHDVNRLMTSLSNKNNLKNIYTMLFSIPGIPSIYYGSEWKLEGHKGTPNDLELRPSLHLDYMNHNKNGDLISHIHKLSNIRSSSKALKSGVYKEILVRHEQFVFQRNKDEESIFVIFNSENKEISLDLNFLKHENFYDLLNERNIQFQNGYLTIPAYSSIIMKKI